MTQGRMFITLVLHIVKVTVMLFGKPLLSGSVTQC